MFSIKKAGKVFNKTASFWNMKLVRGALKYQKVSGKDRALNVKREKATCIFDGKERGKKIEREIATNSSEDDGVLLVTE